MSEPSTPSQTADVASITPGGTANVTPVRLVHPTSQILDLFVDILDEDETDRTKLKNGLTLLFSEHWRVRKWSDMKLFTSEDVKTALVPGNGIPEELLAPFIVKKVGCIVDYARIGILTPDLTLDTIMGLLDASKTKASSDLSIIGSPSRKGSETYDKKNMPKLGKFSGLDEDYFAWKDSTVNSMGIGGFGIFLKDKSEVQKHPSIGESVFYLLRTAVHGGQAQSIAQAMVDDDKLDPVTLWTDLAAYYDTAINRANVVLFDVRRLLSIRLDPDVSGSSFVSDFRDCLQRLRKNKAKLAEDKDTLRALLLVAIQDEAFDTVRDSIVHRPDSSVEAILTEIRERETSLNIKDQASSVSGDGAAGTRHSRRTVSFSAGTQQRSSGGDSGTTNRNKWNIPKFPDTWKIGIGASFFKLLLEWRIEAHKGKNQFQLNEQFNTMVERFKTPAANVSGKRGQQNKSRRAKKAATGSGSPSNLDGTTTPETGNDDASDGTGEEMVTRKRIRLQKSRRILSERSA